MTRQHVPSSHQIRSADGMRLHVLRWSADHPRVTLILAPGLGDHAGRYNHAAERLIERLGTIEVVGFDFRGHGRSDGARGVVGTYDELIDDLAAVVRGCQSCAPERPVFVLGHSNGGLVALTAAATSVIAVDGLVVVNPSLRIAMPVPALKLLAGKVLRMIAPRVTLEGKVPVERLTSDPSMAAQRATDPLVHARLSAPLFFGMLQAARRLRNHPERITTPLLVLLGGSDSVIDPQTTVELFAAFGSADKTLRRWDDARHELLHERIWGQVVDEIADWIAARSGRESALSPSAETPSVLAESNQARLNT